MWVSTLLIIMIVWEYKIHLHFRQNWPSKSHLQLHPIFLSIFPSRWDYQDSFVKLRIVLWNFGWKNNKPLRELRNNYYFIYNIQSFFSWSTVYFLPLQILPYTTLSQAAECVLIGINLSLPSNKVFYYLQIRAILSSFLYYHHILFHTLSQMSKAISGNNEYRTQEALFWIPLMLESQKAGLFSAIYLSSNFKCPCSCVRWKTTLNNGSVCSLLPVWQGWGA